VSKPTQFDSWPSTIHPGFGPYRATTERVVDGDTLHAFVDLGLNHYAYVSVRLRDVDAPEIFTSDPEEKSRGLQAKAVLGSICPVGTKALMTTQKDAQSFGRYVAVLRKADGTVVNDEMNRYLGV
jgi:endonuclease YncB( thermonuclease family)